MSDEVLVVPTGVANLASVLTGLRRIGAEARLDADERSVARAQRVILPGVGAFGAGMAKLREMRLVDALRKRIDDGSPTLAVSLGLQLLCESSEEDAGVAGLAVVPLRATRFDETVSVPQMGWNRVTPDAGCRFITGGHAYFANSYRLTECPAGWTAAWSHHGAPFIAAMERGDVLACQFHPELSGAWGLDVLKAWFEAGRKGGA